MSSTADFSAALPPALAAHARAVREHLGQAVTRAGGFLAFDAFMHEALYAPKLGYYVAGLPKLGADGDFVTAPEVSPLFGRVIARNIADVLAAMPSEVVVEYGPGSGALADAIIGWFVDHELAIDYRLFDVSPDLAARQQQRLARWMDQPGVRIKWMSEAPAERIDGVIVANEVADALPVRRFNVTADGHREIGIGVRDGELVAAGREPSPAMLADLAAIAMRRGGEFPTGYRSEYAPSLAPWVARLVATLGNGLILLIDYGAGSREYYADERAGGTFRCHFRQRAVDDPLLAPGLMDMTAWVDFSVVADAAVAAGFDVIGFTTQAGFLVAGGLADEYDTALDGSAMLAQASAVKTLTLPGEMGERFRFIGLGRGTLPTIPGFGFQDLRHSL
ncbi:MAG: SAM-dependent methyltransferase [Pseudomonadota bacterium]